MRATMLDVSARYGYPCRDFLPNMNTMVCFQEHMISDMVESADLIAFGGGADISPAIYGHEVMCEGNSLILSGRDRFEIMVWEEARAQEKPILGICRGAQFVCAMSGGAIVQDIDGHLGIHELLTYDDEKGLEITSTHHQQMYVMNMVPNDDFELIGWTDCMSKKYIRDLKRAPLEPDYDPEVLYFRRTRAFAIQGHPEYMDHGNATVQWLKREFYQYFPELA